MMGTQTPVTIIKMERNEGFGLYFEDKSSEIFWVSIGEGWKKEKNHMWFWLEKLGNNVMIYWNGKILEEMD